MRAILLSAGFGTRLRPLTNTIPKCLVPINGKPLLQIWLERLRNAGVGPVLVNTHYLSEKVENFIHGSGFEDDVILVNEPELLGTAGTLISNIDFFEGNDGLLIHADNYCLANLQEFIKAHRERPEKCLMTMMVFRTDTPETCGIVELDKDGVVIGFHEKVSSPPGNLANCAVYIFSKELLKKIQKDFFKMSDISTEILPLIIGKIYVHETKERFLDIGSPESYLLANIKRD